METITLDSTGDSLNCIPLFLKKMFQELHYDPPESHLVALKQLPPPDPIIIVKPAPAVASNPVPRVSED